MGLASGTAGVAAPPLAAFTPPLPPHQDRQIIPQEVHIGNQGFFFFKFLKQVIRPLPLLASLPLHAQQNIPSPSLPFAPCLAPTLWLSHGQRSSKVTSSQLQPGCAGSQAQSEAVVITAAGATPYPEPTSGLASKLGELGREKKPTFCHCHCLQLNSSSCNPAAMGQEWLWSPLPLGQLWTVEIVATTIGGGGKWEGRVDVQLSMGGLIWGLKSLAAAPTA